MNLEKTCPFCKTLDVGELLGVEFCEQNNHKKLIRYYCNNPQSPNDYCPCAGNKSHCPNARN